MACPLAAGRPSTPSTRAHPLSCLLRRRCGGCRGLGNSWIGIAAIIAFGFPDAVYNAVLPSWCSERFGHLGQGAVMGLISTTFYLANILIALSALY